MFRDLWGVCRIAMQNEIQKQKTGVTLWVGHFGLGCFISVKGLPHITESTGCNPIQIKPQAVLQRHSNNHVFFLSINRLQHLQ